MLRESRTVKAGRQSGTVIHCGMKDTVLSDVPVSVVFCYQRGVDIDRLADGLARALDHIPSFGGRIRDDGDTMTIACDDSGVAMSVYDFDDTLPEVIGRLTVASSDFVDHVDAPAATKGELPLLTVRVTALADGAMVLGCSWHHTVGDMASFMLLMQAWSAFVDGTTPPEVRLLTDPDAELDTVVPPEDSERHRGFRLPDETEAAQLNQALVSALRANRVVQAYFTDAEIARMKAEISAAAGRRLSTNDVLCGHIQSTIRALDEDVEARPMALPVNVRKHIGLPDSIVGNLTSEIYLTLAGKSPADVIAVDIREAVNDFVGSQLNIRTDWAFIESLGRAKARDCVPTGFNPMNKSFAITNWSRFGVYDITFDGMTPAVFSPVTNLALPWVAWLVEGFGGDGMLFMIALPAKLASKLRGADGRAALHAYREPDEELPALAMAVRKLA